MRRDETGLAVGLKVGVQFLAEYFLFDVMFLNLLWAMLSEDC